MSNDLSNAEDGNERYTVPALERGLLLLCEFSRDRRTLSAPDLARRLKLPRSTVFRLLSTLETMGFVEKAEGGRDYRLGVAVLRLGFEYLASLELTDLGRPILERLCEDIHLPCNLVIRDQRSIVYIAKISPPTPFASSVTVGTRLPAHATVLGHILLGELSLEALRELYPDERLEAFTDRTPRNAEQLFDACRAIREQGYAMSEGFFEPGISTVAAPVLDHAGRVVAALGSTVMAPKFDADRLQGMVARVKEAASELSTLLRYSRQSSDG